jgi:transcriptional regulator GlxA family with amidase domain
MVVVKAERKWEMSATPPRHGPGGVAAPSVQHDHVRAILAIIETEPPHTIQELARRLDLSDSHIKHLFKRHTGLSLGHLLTERRMQGAADLLTRSRMCIKEIAYTVGYKQSSSFIRAFERHFTCAPQHYRRKITDTKS